MVFSHRELDAWQLADELRRRVVRITTAAPFECDLRFRDQLRNCAASVPANIAEGFRRVAPADFARFLAIARGSLAETEDRLRDGLERGYMDDRTTAELLKLSARCDRVVGALRGYLLRRAKQKP